MAALLRETSLFEQGMFLPPTPNRSINSFEFGVKRRRLWRKRNGMVYNTNQSLRFLRAAVDFNDTLKQPVNYNCKCVVKGKAFENVELLLNWGRIWLISDS